MFSKNSSTIKSVNSTRKLVVGFILIIFLGTFLLMMPFSSAKNEFTDFLTAFFTSTSATCVTGLVTVETFTYWSSLGKLIILILIQVGGIGFMTMATILLSAFKRNISLKNRIIMSSTLGQGYNENAVKVMKYVVYTTVIVEGIGALLLGIRFSFDYGVVCGFKKGIFHSVSAFCNAGFDIMGSQSLAPYRDDWFVNIILILLIVIGGLGFIVWYDIIENKRAKKLSYYSKIVLQASFILIIVGGIFLFFSEYSNDRIYSNASFGDKLISSIFQSTSARTAGFASVDLANYSISSKIIMIILMFIGGGSASTAGGIKMVTFVVLTLTVCQVALGRNKIKYKGRTISQIDIMRAFSIFFISVATVLTSAIIISYFDKGIYFIDILFECVSAFATVGLATINTGSLSCVSQMILIFLMFFGKIGILSLTFAIRKKLVNDSDNISYPDAKILIG